LQLILGDKTWSLTATQIYIGWYLLFGTLVSFPVAARPQAFLGLFLFSVGDRPSILDPCYLTVLTLVLDYRYLIIDYRLSVIGYPGFQFVGMQGATANETNQRLSGEA
jgi:hypothetical protein